MTMKKNTTMYQRLANYNIIRVMDQVRSLLKKDGAVLLEDEKRPYTINVKCYTMEQDEEKKEKIEQLPTIKARSISKDNLYSESLYFILNGYYYYISYDENPFFPITFSKIKINDDGSYQGKRYLYSNESINDKAREKDEEGFTIGYDNIFRIINNKEVKEIALYHYETMKKYIFSHRESERVSERIRVNNYYNNKYHYETIYDKTQLNIYRKA